MINLDNRDALSGKVDIQKLAAELRKSAEVALRNVGGPEVVTQNNIEGVICIGIEKRCNAAEAVQAWADVRRGALLLAAAETLMKEKK